MKKALLFLVVAVLAMSTASAVAYYDEHDFYQFCADEPDYQAGWWGPPTSGNYGGADLDEICLVREITHCDGEDHPQDKAGVTMNFPAGQSDLCMYHLDGLSNLDNFEVWVGDMMVGTYTDVHDSTEVWEESCFDVTLDNGGYYDVTIIATDMPWEQCETYGQVAFDWFRVMDDNEIPEFGVIGAGLALVGAGLVAYRKRK